MRLSDLPIIELDSVDSTNNYAMRLIDADKAQAGLTIAAKSQVSGRGQRGNTWVDSHGHCLLMSIIVKPSLPIHEQFLFSAAISTGIANVLQKLYSHWDLRIKWPNDIIINDKKAGGILIENVLRGSRWTHSVIGLGLNVTQESFSEELPNAISLKIASGLDFEIDKLREKLRVQILANTVIPPPPRVVMKDLNDKLYKKGQLQKFKDESGIWLATIVGVKKDGTLDVKREDGTAVNITHGQAVWVW
jgi:BirA family biotin operon repressor/biotin-[acetyl-CoA-carboxylase] ligase